MVVRRIIFSTCLGLGFGLATQSDSFTGFAIGAALFFVGFYGHLDLLRRDRRRSER